jgi:hypothetical protein
MNTDLTFCESVDTCTHSDKDGWHQEILFKNGDVKRLYFVNNPGPNWPYSLQCTRTESTFTYSLILKSDQTGEWEVV